MIVRVIFKNANPGAAMDGLPQLHCLKNLHRKQCPFDQTVIQSEPEELVVNTALLQLAGYAPPAQPFHPPCIKALPENDRQAYDAIVRCLEHLAIYLKLCGSGSTSLTGGRLSRPMQRKLVTLLQCAMTDDEGRGRAARAARSLGERTVTELILQHQNPQQLSANLWAAVRARGCQFLGPAMQEEVLKLVLLALEDGSALSRKVLVMFVVQRLEPHFPQASKTSIGHVVQLLYRASCFKVSKRECDSSLMQLKEEFRTYDSLRREHDAQIVQIATEAGLRIAPDQWSALLYGDTAHKSHMQSIIDKLQTPQSFAQSVQELFIALQRTGDPAQLVVMSMHLDRLASIDASPDAKSPSWQQLAEMIMSIKEVVSGLIHYLQQQGRDSNHNQRHILQDRCSEPSTSQTLQPSPTHFKRNMPMCRESAMRAFCPKGSDCTLLHFDEEYERERSRSMANNVTNSLANNLANNMANSMSTTNGNYAYVPQMGGVPQVALAQPLYQYPVAPVLQHPQILVDNYSAPPGPQMAAPQIRPEMVPNSEYSDNHRPEVNPSMNSHGSSAAGGYGARGQVALGVPHNGVLLPVPERPVFYQGCLPIGVSYPLYPPAVPYQPRGALPPRAGVFSPRPEPPKTSPYGFEDRQTKVLSDYQMSPFSFGLEVREPPVDTSWSSDNNVFNFDEVRNVLLNISADDMFAGNGDQLAAAADNLVSRNQSVTEFANMADDKELEEELQALERRIDTEFKSD
ncbi:unnamed protein product, partial [Iphiclides podalirius]